MNLFKTGITKHKPRAMSYLLKMKQSKVFQKTIALYYRVIKWVSFWDHDKQAFVIFPCIGHLPLSDAELEECRVLLAPKGYTVERSTTGYETIIYPPMTEEEKEQRRQTQIELFQKLTQES